MLAVACVGGLAGPARADDDALRREVDELKKRLATVEEELAKSKQAPKPGSADADALKAARGSRFTVSGYAEMRATNIGNASSDRVKNGDLDFQVTRFRPRFSYIMDPHFMGTIQLNASTRSAAAANVNLRDAFLEYHNAGFYARMGQQKVPYGYDVFRNGDEVRETLERARVFAILFPDERDIGLTFGTVSKNPRAPTFAVGVVNGDGVNRSDGDPDKSYVGNALLPLGKHNVIGASFYTGTTSSLVGGKTQSAVKKAVGVEHRLTLGRFSTQAEYLWGRAFLADVNGGYGLARYNTGRLGNFFARYDIFDPSESKPGDYWSRSSVGWFKDFTRQFRLTAEYDFVQNRATKTSHDDVFGIEAQANF
jgi:hypothetical protein